MEVGDKLGNDRETKKLFSSHALLEAGWGHRQCQAEPGQVRAFPVRQILAGQAEERLHRACNTGPWQEEDRRDLVYPQGQRSEN